jgi:hypothetical protein
VLVRTGDYGLSILIRTTRHPDGGLPIRGDAKDQVHLQSVESLAEEGRSRVQDEQSSILAHPPILSHQPAKTGRVEHLQTTQVQQHRAVVPFGSQEALQRIDCLRKIFSANPIVKRNASDLSVIRLQAEHRLELLRFAQPSAKSVRSCTSKRVRVALPDTSDENNRERQRVQRSCHNGSHAENAFVNHVQQRSFDGTTDMRHRRSSLQKRPKSERHDCLKRPEMMHLLLGAGRTI